MLIGEKMPDKNDPKYKERYEKEVNTGRRFARMTRIDRAAAKVQGFANVHRRLFLVIVFTFLATSFAWNIHRIVVVYQHRNPQHTATEMQDSLLMQRRHDAQNSVDLLPTYQDNRDNKDNKE